MSKRVIDIQNEDGQIKNLAGIINKSKLSYLTDY